VSPQHSNRAKLVDGALRCLERLPLERITARAIAEESGANLASISYHFGSKDELVTAAAIEGLDRWLAELGLALGRVVAEAPTARLQRAATLLFQSRKRHLGLVRNYVSCLAMAQHEPRIRKLLAGGFRRARPRVAALLNLGDDQAAQDAAGLLLAQFHGMLLQVLLDARLAIDGRRLERAQARLRELSPGSPARRAAPRNPR
jgi:AcrR family transcriptional regulator